MQELINKLGHPGILLTIAIVAVFITLLMATTASTKGNSQRYLNLKRVAEQCLSSANCELEVYVMDNELYINPDYMKPKQHYGVKPCEK